MEPLEQVPLGQRVMLTVAIVVGLLLLLAFIGWLGGGWNVTAEDYTYGLAAAEEPLTASKYDERILELDKEAIEQAYRDQIAHLYSVWLKSGDIGAPERARTGAMGARAAFIAIMKALERREEELKKLRELSPVR